MPKNTKAKQQKPKVENIRAKLVNGIIDVSWTLSKKCKAEYKYQVFCDGQKFGEEIWTTETHFQHDPQNGSDYYFEVGICNGNGDHKKIRSNAVHIHHLNLRNVNVCKDDELENVHITWDKLEKPNVKYHIKACRDDGTVVIKDTTKQNEWQLQGFQRSQNYTFSVTANFSGEDGPSFVSEKIRFSPARPNAKTRVTNKGIVVSWTGVEHVQLIYIVAVDCDDKSIVRKEVTETRYCFLNPKPSKKYSFEVWAKDGDMEGQHVRVHHATAPVVIGDIKAIQKDQSILVSWRKLDEDGVKYFVQTFCDGKKVGEPCPSLNDNPQFDFIPTKCLAKYSFRVWAQNTLGVDGKKSTSKDIMMTPRRLRSITAIETDEGIVVTWDKSDDGDVHYVVQALCDDKKCGKQVTSDASFVYCKPQPATKYRFQVSVQHAGGIDGEKAESNTIITRAPQLKNVKATYSFGKIKITWQNGVVDGAIYHLKIYGDGLDCGTHSMTDCIYQHDPLKNIKSYRYEIWCEIRGVHGKPCTLEAPSVCLMQIEGITVIKDNAGFHVSWQDECDTGNTYQVQVLCNGEKSGGIHKTTETRFLLKDPSHSVKYQFQIWPESPGGIVGGKICSEILEIPAPLKSVSAKRNGNSITVAWRGPESSGIKHMVQVYCDGEKHGVAQRSDANQFHFPAAEYGRKYNFVVWAETDHNICGKPVRSDSVIMPPAKLQCVEAHQQGNNIRVTWEKCSRSNVKYRVQVNCNGQKLGPTRNPSTNEFLFTESEHSKKYCFTVWARTAGGVVGEKADSNSVAMPPSPIDGLDVRIHGKGISVSWEPLKSLVIYNVLTYCNEEEVQPLHQTKETHFFLKSPEHSKKYSFKVWATANGKNGEPVLSSSLLVPLASLKNVEVSSDDGSLILSWDRQDENDALYHVQTFCDGQVCRSLHTTRENYFKLQSAQFSKKYDFEVWSESHGMEGSKSKISKLMPPGSIQQLKTVKRGEQIHVSWQKPENDDVTYSVKTISDGKSLGNPTSTSHPIFDFSAAEFNKVYRFEVSAINCYGIVGKSTISDPVIMCPASIQGLQLAQSENGIVVSWKDEQVEQLCYMIQVICNGMEEGDVETALAPLFQLPLPKYSSKYEFIIWAKNQHGAEGPRSTTNAVITAPASVMSLKAAKIGKQIKVSWISPENIDLFYISIHCNESSDGTRHRTANSEFHFESPQPSKAYHFEVWGVNSNGIEGKKLRSETVAMPPSPVANLTAAIKGQGLDMSWVHPNNNAASFCLQIFCNGSCTGGIRNTTEPHFHLEPVSFSSAYRFEVWPVSSYNVEGDKSMSDTVFTSPAQLQNVEASRKGDVFVVSWLRHARDIDDEKMIYRVQVKEEECWLAKIHDTSDCSFTYKPPDVMASYRFNVWAKNSHRIEGRKSKSDEVRMYVKAGNGVYFDKSKPLREDYGVYEGYLIGATRKKEKIAVKICSVKDCQKQWVREVNHMQEVSLHDNTVTYRHSGEYAEVSIYIAMELCHRETLYDMVKLSDSNRSQNGAEGTNFVLVLLHVARGLLHIHENGILHRDLKPLNVLRSLDGKNMKIADFGLSKKLNPEKSTVSKSCCEIGTDGWGSPEHYTGEEMRAASDIFSAGLLFYFTLSGGKHAFGTEPCRWKINIIDRKSPDLCGLMCPYPEIAANLILKMLEQEPDERPSAEDVLKHPFFWSNKNRIDFICEMKKFMEPYQSDSADQHKNDQNVDKMIEDLRKNTIQVIGCHGKGEDGTTVNWAEKLKTSSTTNETVDHGANYSNKPETHNAVYMKATEIVRKKKQKYKYDCIFELLRFIRNLCEHFQEEKDLDVIFETREDIWDYIYKRFPKLFCVLYDAACKYRDSSPDNKLSGDVEKLFTNPADYKPLKK